MTADRTAGQPGDPPADGGPSDPLTAGSLADEIIRQSIDAVIVTDLDLRVRIWNPAAERLYGIPSAGAVGRPTRELLDSAEPDGRPLDSGPERAELLASGSWRRRVVHRPRFGPLAGRNVVVDSLVSLLRGPDGSPEGALGVNRDISASARLETELTDLASLVIATGRGRTVTEVAQAAIELLCRTTGADAGLVSSTEGLTDIAASHGLRRDTTLAIIGNTQVGGPLTRALEAPDAWVSASVSTAPLRDDLRAAAVAEGIEHLVVVGLRLSGRLTGLLALGWRQRPAQEPSRAILQQAAALIAASLENARLLAAVESGLSEERLLTRRMRALVELTRLPETSVAGYGTERLMIDIGAIIGADGSVHGRVEGDRLILNAVDRIAWSDAEPLVNRPLTSIPVALQLAAGGPAVLFALGDRPTTPEGAAASAKAGFQSAAAFAIRDDNRLHGVLFALFRRPIGELEIDERTLESIGRVLDISIANRRLREVVTASERRYRDLFEGSPDALLVQTVDEVIVDANPAAIRLYGGDVVGRPVADLTLDQPVAPPRDPEQPRDLTQSTRLGRRLDGSTFPEEVDLRPIDIDGERRLLAIVRDLTERSKMQAELVQAQKMEAIGLLVAGVAHELNNPLAAIVGFSHLLRTDPNLPTDLRHQADLLVQEANRTRVIVQNLLDFARQRPPERVEAELRPLIDSVLGLQSYVLARNRIRAVVDLEPDLPPLAVDRSQMQQVLINLTVNATQAIHELGRSGTIRIRARAVPREGDRTTIRIEVADDGPGVPASVADRLFMPFVTTKEPGEGTGLGLSVSFGIVASHGGTLRHETNADGGATFIIELPVGSEPPVGAVSPVGAVPPETPEAASAPEAAGLPPSDPAAAAQRRLRILVLDDEPAIREFLRRVLTRSGHEPILADTGPAALEIVRSDPPDVILCDHRMAGMNGTEFHAAVMAIAPRLAGRFAFMSGDVLNPELREFADARGVHLLAKPFDIAAVGAIVSTLVAGSPGA